jgi:hypothetical protein
MLPIFALAESQSWRRDDFNVYLRCESELVLNAYLATVGRDGDLPANPAEDAWFDAATVGLDGVRRDWGPSWTMPREVWPTLAARLGVWLSLRQLHYDEARPDLATLLVAELRNDWRATAYWTFGPTDTVMVEVYASGAVAITSSDAHLDALRAHTGLAIAPTNVARRMVEIDRAAAIDVLERVVTWSASALTWVNAAVFGAPPART